VALEVVGLFRCSVIGVDGALLDIPEESTIGLLCPVLTEEVQSSGSAWPEPSVF